MLARNLILIVCVLIMLGLSVCSLASVPLTITYQGKLTDEAGVPMTGTKQMKFSLWNASLSGSKLWEEPVGSTRSVEVLDGLFTVLLGTSAPLSESVLNGNVWLQVEIDGVALPRVQVVSAPFAVRSLIAEKVQVPVSVSGNQAYPQAVILSTNSGDGFGLHGQGTSSLGEGVRGTHLSSGNYGSLGMEVYGVYGYSNDDAAIKGFTMSGRAVDGQAWTGTAGRFTVSEASATEPAVFISTAGTGPALRAQGKAGGLAADLIGIVQMTGFKLTTGAGNGLVLKSDASGVGTWQEDSVTLPFSSITSNASTLFYLRNSGAGRAIYASTEGAGDALYALASGTGSAGEFSVNNTGSSANALHCTSNGSGAGLSAYNTGTGRAGYFQINNTGNSADALRVMTNGSGNAIYASTTGSGNAGLFSGDVYITGNLKFPSGKPKLPIAYGVIGSDGTKIAGTSNITSSWDSANQRYQITISGVSYSNATHVAVANCSGMVGPRVIMTSSASGSLIVTLFDLTGVKSQGMFDFVVYEP